MTKKIIILVMLVMGIGVYYFYPRAKNDKKTKADIWVQSERIKSETFPIEVKAIGTLIAPTIKITPEVAGHVDKILFRDGEELSEGTVLVQLDDAIERVKAQSTKAQLEYAKTNFQRMTLLSKRGAISKKDMDDVSATLKEKEALAEENNVLVSKMQLRAPFTGVVGRSKVNRGEYVTIGQEVVTLTDNKHLRVEYNLPEHYRPSLKMGQNVTIFSPTYPNHVFQATLAYISPNINVTNRSITLYATINNTDQKLIPGMFVNIFQSLGQDNNAILVPARSVMVGMGGEEIYKVVSGKAVVTKVTLGKRTPLKVQVLSGLQAGDEIITDGQLKVKNGDTVKIAPQKQQEAAA